MNDNKKSHWEHIYDVKTPEQVSWTQNKPETSLDFIHSFGEDKTANIIDIGGGESKLVDFLLEEGYEQYFGFGYFCKRIGKSEKTFGRKS